EGATPGVQLKLFSSKHEIEHKLAKLQFHNRVIRVYSSPHNFDGTSWVCGDFLIMIVTKTSPHYLIEMYDPILCHNMREMFKMLWEKTN
ncbi:MAG TPA: hypothetical protein VEA59_05500, partial [Patescibacteria group bacterium]|nr:hypothetical protein [Patescibacteria group bacterium]